MQISGIVRRLGAVGLLASLLGTAGPAAARAQNTGEIAVRVVTGERAPATDAAVRILGLGQRTPTDETGAVRFAGVPAGRHVVEATSPRSGRAIGQVTVEAGVTVELVLRLTPFELEPLVVTGSPTARTRSELYQAASALSGLELARRAAATLGETLQNEPGVTSTYFGPGASRPVIRGLGGDRVRVLEGGVGTGDASNTSPDHAVSLDPQTAERIEIIRGPATLLYGGAAIGGVVNVIDGRIPRELPSAPLTGTLTAIGGTVADERNASLDVSGAAGRVAWHLSGLRRVTGDYTIPGFAEADHADEDPGAGEEEEGFGVLENSALETTRFAAGLSYVGRGGYLGVSWSGYETEYGIPGHGHEEPTDPLAPPEEEQSVRIDMRQRRVDVEGSWRTGGRTVGALKGRLGVTDYEHTELEGTEVGTVFRNNSWEGRLEAQHGRIGPLGGAVGLQLGRRDFEAIGEEAFVPPTQTTQWAVFLFEEIEAGSVRYQFGARYERQDTENVEAGVSRDFDGISVSGGINWFPAAPVSLALSVARSVKLPTAEELFSNGPHLATNAFEIGDADLGREAGVSVDASLRLVERPVTGGVTLFVNRFDDFTFQQFTGLEQDGLPELRYTQGDALFTGVEVEAHVDLLHRARHHVALDLWGDYVRAELVDTDEPLPRIPPLRLGAGLRYESTLWQSRVAVRRVTAQDRVAPLEDPTPGYTMFDASVSYRLFSGPMMHEIIVQGVNLTNAEARNHVSFLKALAPLPGRELRAVYRLSF